MLRGSLVLLATVHGQVVHGAAGSGPAVMPAGCGLGVGSAIGAMSGA